MDQEIKTDIQFSLDEALKKITSDNLHERYDFGSSVGEEWLNTNHAEVNGYAGQNAQKSLTEVNSFARETLNLSLLSIAKTVDSTDSGNQLQNLVHQAL